MAIFVGGHHSACSAPRAAPGVAPAAAEPARLAAGEQHPAQNGPEGLGVDVGAVARGDRLGGRDRLLGREPALLDRKVVASPAAKTSSTPDTRP